MSLELMDCLSCCPNILALAHAHHRPEQGALSVRHVAHKSSPSPSADPCVWKSSLNPQQFQWGNNTECKAPVRAYYCYEGSEICLWVIYGGDEFQILQESEVLKPLLSEWLAQIPANRLALLTDLQAAIVYLASEASDYISGHNLIIDGGHTRWWWDCKSISVWMPSFVELYSRFDFCVWSRDNI